MSRGSFTLLVLLASVRLSVSLSQSHIEYRRDTQSIDVTSRWREDWQSVTVVNSTLVVDPTIRLPGFDLYRCQWSLLNRFRTGQGHCNACHKKWGFTDNELCECGEIQTMSHIVNFCPLTKFDGGLLHLHEADEAAVDWLTTYGS